jgi:PQQ-dependent catabolism-associated CXXCW motif protein
MSTMAKWLGAVSMVIASGLAMPAASAQDSFGGAARPQPQTTRPAPVQQPMPTRPMQPAPASRLPEMAMPTGIANGEAQDFGVAPTGQLRPSQQLHGATPTSIPGGKVISTRQLSQLLQGGQRNVLLLHAFGSPEHLPGAQAAGPASQGGSFDDQVQREFGQYLRQATGGDTARMLVVYCAGPQCWGSYNAALRAIHMGFRNVHWYRGGIEAWRQAGLPLQDGQGRPVPPSGAVGQGRARQPG